MRAVTIILLVVTFIAVSYSANLYYQNSYQSEEITPQIPEISKEGYIETNVDVQFSDLIFYTDCYSLLMGITDDQAYSISNALENKIVRPLTHDIIKDILEDYDFKILMIKIESYNDGIFYAKITLMKDNKILDLDARPSDAAAIAIRMNEKIYFTEDLLKEHGIKTC